MKPNLEFVKKMMEMLEASGLAQMELETKEFRLFLSKPQAQAPAQIVAGPVPTAAQAPAPEPATQKTESPAAATEASPDAVPPGLHGIKSPIVGTFYRAPAPGAEPFTDVGKRVHKGQTLCIVEAMKVMNEIESDVDGVVEKILVENAQPVEYGQLMFLIKPD